MNNNIPSSNLKIGKKNISISDPVFFIAEIGSNFEGSLSRAEDLICLAKEAGADAVKFQHYSAETLISDIGFKGLGSKKSHQATWKKSVFETYNDASLEPNWTKKLSDICEREGIIFFTSPYSLDLVDLVDKYVPAHKIGSGDITWIKIIEHIAQKNKPVLLSTGASDLSDVLRAVDSILKINKDLILMQCNTNYTAHRSNFNHLQLSVISKFQEIFPGILTGLSDHTHGDVSVIGAVTLGARVIEKHFTDSISREGPDHPFSMTPITWKDMVERTRDLQASLGNGVKKVEKNEIETKLVQRRSICARYDIKEGTIITSDNITMLRPCPEDGIEPYHEPSIVGKILKRNLQKGELLKWEYIT